MNTSCDQVRYKPRAINVHNKTKKTVALGMVYSLSELKYM
jgi:hypothetical protein